MSSVKRISVFDYRLDDDTFLFHMEYFALLLLTCLFLVLDPSTAVTIHRMPNPLAT